MLTLFYIYQLISADANCYFLCFRTLSHFRRRPQSGDWDLFPERSIRPLRRNFVSTANLLCIRPTWPCWRNEDCVQWGLQCIQYPVLEYCNHRWNTAPSAGIPQPSLEYCTQFWSTAPSAGIVHPVLQYFTQRWNTAPSAGVLHQALEYYTQYWSTSLSAEILHQVLEYCTECWNTALGAEILHPVLENAPSAWILHPVQEYCTQCRNTASSAGIIHPVLEYCTQCRISLYMKRRTSLFMGTQQFLLLMHFHSKPHISVLNINPVLIRRV